jgi:hypothetical protein
LRWTEEQFREAQRKPGRPHGLDLNRMPRKDLRGLLDAAAKGAEPRKYRNTRVTDEFGEAFDSKRELKRWRELLTLQRAGEVRFLAKQVRFHLPGQTTYIADFVWMDALGKIRVEDVKSPATRKLAAYRIKVRQMAELHGIEVEER